MGRSELRRKYEAPDKKHKQVSCRYKSSENFIKEARQVKDMREANSNSLNAVFVKDPLIKTQQEFHARLKSDNVLSLQSLLAQRIIKVRR